MLKLKKIASYVSMVTLIAVSVTSPAYAHVVVNPKEVTTATFQTFNMSVPNEKTDAVTMLKLNIPDGLSSVSPTVKPGWTISEDKTGDGEAAVVKSITWTAGSIPADQRDDFGFSAKTPDKATDLDWKAYQTYEDGTVVSWDQAPKQGSEEESETTGPFSVTKVVTDSTQAVTDKAQTADTKSAHDNASSAQTFAIVALAISLVALGYSVRKSRSDKA